MNGVVHLVYESSVLPATVQLGMRLTGKGGSTANVKLMNTDYNSWVETITLNSTTERYYNIEAVVDWVKQSDGTFITAAPVVVTNTSDAIISLTSLKWAFNDENSVTELNLMSDEMTPVYAQAAVMRLMNPVATPQDTILNKDSISHGFTGEPYTFGDNGELIITTQAGVAGVTVNGTDAEFTGEDENGMYTWKYEFTADTTGTMTFEIIACDENGFTSESIYATTNIEGVAVDDKEPEDEPVIPDDDSTDDSDDGVIIFSPDSFVNSILNGIFNLLRKLLGFFMGGMIA